MLFLNENTFSGNKIIVYVLLKILNKCSAANLSSFQLKFAVHSALSSPNYETAETGTSLKRVLRYWSMRSKFNGVHSSLEDIGVTEVKVEDDGLLFVMSEVNQKQAHELKEKKCLKKLKDFKAQKLELCSLKEYLAANCQEEEEEDMEVEEGDQNMDSNFQPENNTTESDLSSD